MVEFTIERVRAEDLAATVDLFIQQVYPGDPEGAYLHFSGHAEGQAETFLAWVDGHLAGYLTLRWESNNPLFRQHNIPLIHHLGGFPAVPETGDRLPPDGCSRALDRHPCHAGRHYCWPL